MIPNLGIAELELKGNKAVLNIFRPRLPLLLLMNIASVLALYMSKTIQPPPPYESGEVFKTELLGNPSIVRVIRAIDSTDPSN